VWKYRDRGDKRRAIYSHGNNKLEVVWTTAAAILFIGLNLMGFRAWAKMYFTGSEPGALRIEVLGEQFAFYFRYPGSDGKFGPTHVEKVDDATGNFFGLDRERDADSKDDVVTATMGIPANRPVELILRAKDVSHSFFVRELRVQQDMVPGMEIPIHFTATEEALKNNGGKYEIVCTQLCGLGHYKMRAFLQVMKEDEFEKWLQTQAAARRPRRLFFCANRAGKLLTGATRGERAWNEAGMWPDFNSLAILSSHPRFSPGQLGCGSNGQPS
jgi:cytochrome c oxidase subunit 2